MKKIFSRKNIIIYLGLIIIVVVVFFYYSRNIDLVVNSEACFNNSICIDLELATTDLSREEGLMFREVLSENEGMLFVYEGIGIKKFWMKNTFIPLDIIWLDSDNKIVYIEKSLTLCEIEQCNLYGPDFPTNNVLEVNAGFVGKNNIRIGDIIEIKL